ncbi:MATE family efflux transporter [Oscillospiraceae bacterium PP1C4]
MSISTAKGIFSVKTALLQRNIQQFSVLGKALIKGFEMIIEKDINFYKRLYAIAIPVSLQTLLSLGINLADNFMIGKLGGVSLSAVAIANQFYTILHYTCLGLGNGCAVLTGQYYGAGKNKEVRSLVALLYKLTFGIVLSFITVTLLFKANIMDMYSNSAEVTNLAAEYLGMLTPTFIFMAINVVSCSWLRSIGIVKVAMLASSVSFLLKLGINYVLIFGNFGVQPMGIKGAAIATMAARGVEFLIIVVYILRYEKKVCLKLGDFKGQDKELTKLFLKKGQPVLFSDMMIALGQNGVSIVMGNISASMLAASSIATTVVQISAFTLIDLTGAAATLVSNSAGSGDTKRAYRQGVTSSMLSFITGIGSSIVIFLLRDFIVSLYTLDAYTADMTYSMLTVTSVIVFFTATGCVLSKGILRGGGDTKYLMVVDIIFLWTVSIPLGYFVGIVLGMPPWVAYLCIRLDEVFRFSICLHRLFSKKWIKVFTKTA